MMLCELIILSLHTPREPEIKEATKNITHASCIYLGQLSSKLYDKIDYFNLFFPVINVLQLDTNISPLPFMEFIFHNSYTTLEAM